ncbi:MAG: excalibur calcium-binding domain-containing protein [Gammaproteobacteria bacterium]|nr:excalibur calcium-binding domain-containing protein [Gammaproteobacteria bacterium]
MTEHQPPSPRAAQIAAQQACISTLEAQDLTKTCTNISTACPEVEPILTGEPLYESLRDADSDGVVCETL